MPHARDLPPCGKAFRAAGRRRKAQGALLSHGVPCTVLDGNIEGLLYLLRQPVAASDTWTRRARKNLPQHLAELRYPGTYRLRQTPEQIAAAAVQEDVDAVGLSILSGAHNRLLPELTRLLKQAGAEDVLVFAGGSIPDRDIAGLRTAGIDALFLPGTPTGEIIKYLERRLAS